MQGSSRGCPFPITPQLASGTSFQAPGRSPIGSQTTSRVSPDTRRRTCRPGYICLSRRTSQVKQLPRPGLAAIAERPPPPAVASRERALERVLDPSRSPLCPGQPACPGQPGSSHDPRQLRRDLVSGGRAVPSIGGHLAGGDLQTGHAVPTRLGRQQVPSTDGITLSVREGCGERTQSRRYVAFLAIRERVIADDITGRSGWPDARVLICSGGAWRIEFPVT